MSTTPRPPWRRFGALGWGTCGVVLLLGLAGRFANGFEWDELQLLHGAWSIGSGLVPYRDFFEHHPPLAHALLAPAVASASSISPTLLVAMRFGAAVLLLPMVLAFHRVVQHTGTAIETAWSAVTLLAIVPLSGKLFELRADWMALVLVFVAVATLTGHRARRSALRAFVAGVAWGLAITLTQKAIPSWAAACAWCIAVSLRAGDRPVRRVVGPFAIGTAAPLALLAAVFMALGAGRAMYVGTITTNVGWPAEVAWRDVWGGAAWGLAAPLALAASEAARCLGSWWADESNGDETTLLVVVLWLSGLIAYVTTPVPWEQSLLFFVAPWTACLALRALGRTDARDATAHPRVRTPMLVGLAALALAMPAGRRIQLFALATAIVLAATALSRRSPGGARLAIVLLLLPGLLLFGRDRCDELMGARFREQLAFARAVAALHPHTGPVLTMWDHVVPFRPALAYHWFLHSGVLERFADADGVAADIDTELMASLSARQDGAIIIADPVGLAYLPRVDRFLSRHCRLAVFGYAGSDAYACEAPAAP